MSSIVRLTADVANEPKLQAITPTRGDWFVVTSNTVIRTEDGSRVTWFERERIVAFGIDDEGAPVVLVPGDGYALAFPAGPVDRVVHKDDFYACECKPWRPADHDGIDVTFCTRCSGEARPLDAA